MSVLGYLYRTAEPVEQEPHLHLTYLISSQEQLRLMLIP